MKWKKNASDFDSKVLQRVSFSIEKNTTRQILNLQNYKESDLE